MQVTISLISTVFKNNGTYTHCLLHVCAAILASLSLSVLCRWHLAVAFSAWVATDSLFRCVVPTGGKIGSHTRCSGFGEVGGSHERKSRPRAPRGSCNNTLLRRVLRRFFTGSAS